MQTTALACSQGPSTNEEYSFRNRSLKGLVEFVFQPFELLSKQVAVEYVESSSVVRYWAEWNTIPWLLEDGQRADWPAQQVQPLKMLLAEVRYLAADAVSNQNVPLHHTQNEFLSSISSVHVGKHFNRDNLTYHQTYGDHLLGIMLRRFQTIYENWHYPKTLLHIRELVTSSSAHQRHQKVPLWQMTGRNDSLEQFICLPDYDEFREHQDKTPKHERRHAAGDLIESMLLILVERQCCRLAFLLVNFLVCLVIDSNMICNP